MICCVVRPSRSIPTTFHIFSSPALNASRIGCGWMRGARPVLSEALVSAIADWAAPAPVGGGERLLSGCGFVGGFGLFGLGFAGLVGRPRNGSFGPPGAGLLVGGIGLPSPSTALALNSCV